MWRWTQKISMRGLCRGVPINRKRNNFGSACVHAMAPPSKLPAVNHAHGGNPCGVGSTRWLILSYLTHVRATRGWLVRCNRMHRQFPSSSRLLHCATIMERLGHHAVGEGATHASTGNCARGSARHGRTARGLPENNAGPGTRGTTVLRRLAAMSVRG
jgi:hypothetical protein